LFAQTSKFNSTDWKFSNPQQFGFTVLDVDFFDNNNAIAVGSDGGIARTTDGGTNWEADIRLTNDPAVSGPPCIGVFANVVHVIWYDNRNGNFEVYYKRSTDQGISWSSDIRLTNDPAESLMPSISVSGSVAHVVWADYRNGNYEIYYKRSTDHGINWSSDIRLTNDPAYARGAYVSVSVQVVHVIWQDRRDGNDEIYYKRDPTGNVVGIININTEIPNEFKLEQNYPNPFNPTTKIRFQIPLLRGVSEGRGVLSSIKIYNSLGMEITSLFNQQLSPGTYEIEWNSRNNPSGVYLCKLNSGNFTETKRMVLIK
jgi:hypothetical protein